MTEELPRCPYRILLTGASGYVGWSFIGHLCKVYSDVTVGGFDIRLRPERMHHSTTKSKNPHITTTELKSGDVSPAVTTISSGSSTNSRRSSSKSPRRRRKSDSARSSGGKSSGLRVRYWQGDLASEVDVRRWLEEAVTHEDLADPQGTERRGFVVFHIASYGMSGHETLRTDVCRAVNVDGTRAVLDAVERCRSHCDAVVYCSTQNTVFTGQRIDGHTAGSGPSEFQYPPASVYSDAYSRTKAEAEQLVRTRGLGSSARTRTVVVRPAGIYGVGEERHLPRIVDVVDAGLYRFTIGSGSNVCEFIAVDNLCHAFDCAARAVLDNPQISGRAYFVSDHRPMNNFAFFAPLVRALAPRALPTGIPSLCIPHGVAYAVATVLEAVFATVPGVRAVFGAPLLSRLEVNKVGVSHWFDPAPAMRDLRYAPLQDYEDAMADVVAYWLDRRRAQAEEAVERPSPRIAVVVVAVAVVFWLLLGLYLAAVM